VKRPGKGHAHPEQFDKFNWPPSLKYDPVKP